MTFCFVVSAEAVLLMCEPDPEPDYSQRTAVAAPATSGRASGNWLTEHILVPVEDVDHSRTPDFVQLSRPASSGDVAARFVDRRIVRFYREPQGNLPDLRFYAVWLTPRFWHNPQRYSGLHFGVGDRAYRGLIAANQGRYECIRWCRTDSLEEAREVYIREQLRHRTLLGYADRIFIWR